MKAGSHLSRRWHLAAHLMLTFGLLSAGCGGGGGSAPAIPGLAEADEVVLLQMAPEPEPGGAFIWTRAFKVGDLPLVQVGHPSARFMADAHRVGTNPDDWVCVGGGTSAGGGSAGCRPGDDPIDPQPHVAGINFGGPAVEAWGWMDVPDQAAAVKFIDHDGATSWQRPVDGVVIFPDTIEGNSDWACPCRFDAIGPDGAVIASVDVEAGAYIDD